MTGSRTHVAARNNAAWCDHVCRAHGGATAFDGALWCNAAPSPRFHPNLVTLREGAGAEVEAALDRLDGRLPAGWGVKDSFADLDLRPRGFELAFEAAWLWIAASTRMPATQGDKALDWTCVATDAALADWEQAWASGPALAPRQFPGRLLSQPEIVFVAGRRAGRVVAGGVLNADAGAVGIGNVFAQQSDLAECWLRLLDESGRRFPGWPRCGYEREGAAAPPAALAAGSAGALRVWLRA